jgi:MFS family permease
MVTNNDDKLDKEGLQKRLSSSPRIRLGIRGFPRQVYFMVFMSLVLALGRNIALPYLWLYLANGSGDVHLSSSLEGFMIMIGGFSYILSLLVTGSLCDRFGRRKMMGFSVGSQVFIVAGYAYAGTFSQFLFLYASYNIITAFYDPAFSAMVADLVQPARREEVFGLNYMMTNVGVVVGSTTGGIIESVSGYTVLFLYAACFIVMGAAILSSLIKESRSSSCETTSPKFSRLFQDRLLLLFCVTGFLTNIVYSQLSGLLSVYTGYAGFQPYIYGILLSLNGAMAVTLQIPMRRAAIRLGATRAFILAQLLFTVGFGSFMFDSDLSQFMFSVAVLTLGEMVFFPSSSGFVANLAPSDMRGRYMALNGVFFRTGSSVGPQLSFIVYGMLADKRLVWGFLGLIGFATLPGYVALLRLNARKRVAHNQR